MSVYFTKSAFSEMTHELVRWIVDRYWLILLLNYYYSILDEFSTRSEKIDCNPFIQSGKKIKAFWTNHHNLIELIDALKFYQFMMTE